MPKELLLLLAIAAVMFYTSSRLLAQSLGGTIGRAIGHFIPILGTALVATWMKMDALAIDVMFASTAMVVTLVIGVALFSAPLTGANIGRRVWPLFLPVAAVTWTAGYLGAIDVRFAVALLGLGGVIGWTAADRRDVPVAREVRDSMRAVIVPLAIIVAGMGAFATVFAGRWVLQLSHPLTEGLLASMVVAPLLVLPMLGAVSESAMNVNSSSRSINICVGTAILLLCLGLPAIMAMRALREHLAGGTGIASFPIPYGVWRADTAVLIVVGLLLVPIGLSRWLPTRVEGLLLVLIYVIYLYMVSPLAASWG